MWPRSSRRSAGAVAVSLPSAIRGGDGNQRILHRGRTWLSAWRSDALGHRGDGVAGDTGNPIYVAGTLPGECVEVADWPGHPDRRQLLNVEKSSPERIAPICPHFGVCGGCALQHWASAPYRAWKHGLVVEALRQAGIEAPVADLVDAHGDGRRRAVFHARRGARRRPRSRFLGGARASLGRHRPLPDSGQEPRWRARRGLGHRRAARRHAKAARYPGDGDRYRPRCRRPRLGSADGSLDRQIGAASPPSKTSRG